jgi:hypothetical protein
MSRNLLNPQNIMGGRQQGPPPPDGGPGGPGPGGPGPGPGGQGGDPGYAPGGDNPYRTSPQNGPQPTGGFWSGVENGLNSFVNRTKGRSDDTNDPSTSLSTYAIYGVGIAAAVLVAKYFFTRSSSSKE